ncbi:NAD(+) diphosphatase [Micromonospora sp. DT233]|uniref:NAD(+) diphosphatase n=1 Tax=Micromonospora sp. DT233 TaxID=3393432 RepID=UPI003CE68550
MTDGETALPLARSTLDRAAHRRSDPQWLAQAWERARVLVLDSASEGRALVRAGGSPPELVLLASGELPPAPRSVPMFLGVEPDDVPVFAVDSPLPELPGTRAAHLTEVGHLLGDRDAGIFTAALALLNWHLRHGWSPATGHRTTVDEAGWSRIDPDGGRVWPRTDPAMIVMVHDGVAGLDGRCLLGSNAAWAGTSGRRRFSCLAGFVEPGESAEAAVLREVGEEVGLAVEEITYAGSQPWPFPGSLMLGFLALADPEHRVRVDPAEIAHARWFTRREIGAALAGHRVEVGEGNELSLPPPTSIARFLIHRWLDGHC